jgi:hypothetical protein
MVTVSTLNTTPSAVPPGAVKMVSPGNSEKSYNNLSEAPAASM